MEKENLQNQKNYNSIETFFALLRAGLFTDHGEGNSVIRIDGATDWENVYQLAQEQSVQGIVLQGIDWFKVHDSRFTIPQVLLLQWIGEVQMIEQRNKEMNAFIAELIEKLRKKSIYTLLVKGQGIAQCYEKPLWRCSGDVDLFLSEDNYTKAKALLLPLVSSVEEEYVREKHLGMTIDGWVVELHGHLYSGLSSSVEKELDALQQDTFYRGEVRSWMNGKTHIFLLKAENDVFYVFTHILQHFYKEGVGLRQVCDWCRLLWTYRDKLDLQLLEGRIKRAGLMTSWKAFGTYAVDYLGMPVEAMPFYSSSKKWSRKAGRINEFILSVGNMGHNRERGYSDKSYLIRKIYSFGRRCGDLMSHARIFPFDSIRFFPFIVFNGLRSAVRGE